MSTSRLLRAGTSGGAVVVALLLVAAAIGPLAVGVAAATPGEEEPNDSRSDATAIDSGEVITGEVAPGGDVDWFAVEVEAGETIEATMTAGPGTNDFKIYRPGGGFRADTDVSDGSGTIGLTAQKTGTYHVRIRAEGEGAEYRFTVETTTTDDFEPNELRENAVPIETGVDRSGTISIADTDWYSFEAEAGETITGTLTVRGGTNDFKIYRPGGGFRADTDVTNGTGTIGLTARKTGTYHVRVRGEGRGGDYTFHVETTTTDDFEPNELRENATPIEAGVNVSGTISIADTDWFAIDLAAGERLDVTLTATGEGTNDFKIYALDGDFVADTDVSNGTETHSTNASSAGTYYVRVQGEGEGADYTFLANTSGADAPTNESTTTAGTTTAGTTTVGTTGPSDEDDGEGGSGTSLLIPLLILLLLVILLVVVVVWRRREEEDR